MMTIELKLTKLERFIADNPDMDFEVMAGQLNRTPGAIERASDRISTKERIAKEAVATCVKSVIAVANLCRGTERFINPRVHSNGFVMLESLDTGELFPFINDGQFKDYNGQPVRFIGLPAHLFKLGTQQDTLSR